MIGVFKRIDGRQQIIMTIDQMKRFIASVTGFLGLVLMLYFGTMIIDHTHIIGSKEIIVSLILVIGLLVISALLFRSTISIVERQRQLMYSFGCILFFFYGVLLMGVLFINQRQQMTLFDVNEVMAHLNLVPLKTVKSYLKAYENQVISPRIVLENIVGNLVLFFPMGLILPTLIKRFRNGIIFASFMMMVLFSVESIQLLTGTGSFDIDDIILNFIGVSVAYGLWHMPLSQKIRTRYFA